MARIFLSSTSTDLAEYRKKVLDVLAKAGHVPVGMEHFPASGRRPLAQCLADVGSCDVYVGVFAWRLGFVPPLEENPAGKSITELELRHAQSLGRPCLGFLLNEEILWPPKYVDDGVKPRPIDRLRKALADELTVDFFTDPGDLAAKILAALGTLEKETRPQEAVQDRSEPSAKPVQVVPLPPELYAVPSYTLTNTFIGRQAELTQLDTWAASSDPVLVVEAIGGMGKSALTWEWVQEHASANIPGLAGRVWWSFYERGTSMQTFLRHTLAYVTRQAPEALLKLDTFDCGQQLLAELRRQPYLLVLDGFERVLTAYHRMDKAQLPDEQVPADKRECTNPKDGDILRQLVHCGPSKALVSTRLMPKVLEDRSSHRPILGVRHLDLEGLAPNDVLRMVKQAGVHGDSSAILQFAEQFGRHALVLRIVCGMITDYRPKPGDFDAWRADPYTGGGLKLSELPLMQTYTHILEYAFRGLGEKQRQLLSRIAVLSDSADYDTVAILNPFLPPQPEEVLEPPDPADSYEEWRLLRRLDQASSQEEREAVEAERSAYRAKRETEYQEQKQAFERYQQALRTYYDSVEYHEAIVSFPVALSDLEERGLLQWNRDTNTYDLHPVIRAYAFEQLEERERTRTFNALGDHFASLPPENVEEATELSHVKNSLEIMRALIGAGRFEESHDFYRGGFSNRLYFSIGAYHVVFELLSPLLRYDHSGKPLLTSVWERSLAMNDLAIVMDQLGKFEEALLLYRESLQLGLEMENWHELVTRLANLAYCNFGINQLASAGQLNRLVYELADAVDDKDGLTGSLLDKMFISTMLGQIKEAESLLTTFRQREQPPFAMYRPGRAEYQLSVLRFYQDSLTEVDLADARQIAVDAYDLHRLAALRAEWELSRDNPKAALEAVEQALTIVRRTGSPAPGYLAIRALVLARLGLLTEAREALAEGEEVWDGRLPAFPLFAAETYLALGDREQAREWIRRAYPLAWADGPPYIRWYDLKRCRELMAELGEPEPQLPPFDPAKVEPIPFEAEIRAVIAKLKAERAEAEEPA